MWMMRVRIGILLAGFMMILGCEQDISGVQIEMSPDQGCAPLKVALVGKATVRDGVEVVYRWQVNGEILPEGGRAQYAFSRPGAYDIVLTVASAEQEQSETAELNVSEAVMPSEPGVYRRLACAYQAIPMAEEQTATASLGKTSLEDLEKIMGRKLSTLELWNHPLWRREHTHTTHTMERAQFGEVALEQFQQMGFVTVGKALGEAALFKLAPSAEPEPSAQVVTRMIDSWGQESIEPATQALERNELTPDIVHYLPKEGLTTGLYLISLQAGEEAPPALRPIALVAAGR